MPQLDILTFSSQISFFFLFFWLVFSLVVFNLPVLISILKIRFFKFSFTTIKSFENNNISTLFKNLK